MCWLCEWNAQSIIQSSIFIFERFLKLLLCSLHSFRAHELIVLVLGYERLALYQILWYNYHGRYILCGSTRRFSCTSQSCKIDSSPISLRRPRMHPVNLHPLPTTTPSIKRHRVSFAPSLIWQFAPITHSLMEHFSSTVTFSARRQSGRVTVVLEAMPPGYATLFWWAKGDDASRPVCSIDSSFASWRETDRRSGAVSTRRIKGTVGFVVGFEGWTYAKIGGIISFLESCFVRRSDVQVVLSVEKSTSSSGGLSNKLSSLSTGLTLSKTSRSPNFSPSPSCHPAFAHQPITSSPILSMCSLLLIKSNTQAGKIYIWASRWELSILIWGWARMRLCRIGRAFLASVMSFKVSVGTE